MADRMPTELELARAELTAYLREAETLLRDDDGSVRICVPAWALHAVLDAVRPAEPPAGRRDEQLENAFAELEQAAEHYVRSGGGPGASLGLGQAMKSVKWAALRASSRPERE